MVTQGKIHTWNKKNRYLIIEIKIRLIDLKQWKWLDCGDFYFLFSPFDWCQNSGLIFDCLNFINGFQILKIEFNLNRVQEARKKGIYPWPGQFAVGTCVVCEYFTRAIHTYIHIYIYIYKILKINQSPNLGIWSILRTWPNYKKYCKLPIIYYS